MKFKTDENLPNEIADTLNRAGHDAVTIFDQQLAGSTDSEISSICKSEERALITLDVGFADIRSHPPEELNGLIVLRLKRQDKPHVLEVFTRLLPAFAMEPLAGKLWIVDEKRIRIWK